LISVNDAIVSLLDAPNFILRGEPTNETEFNEMLYIISWDENGQQTESNDPSGFGVTWSQVSAKLAELQNAEPIRLLRAERDRKIAETDWWVLPDRTATQAQLDYRQALRDITNNATSLDDVTWPEKP
jgi:hypothetical protein